MMISLACPNVNASSPLIPYTPGAVSACGRCHTTQNVAFSAGGGICNTENVKLRARGAYLYLKLEPLLKSRAFCIDLGSSGSLKKAWYSTQFFQKDLHTSRLAMENSSVSLQEGWREINTVSIYHPQKDESLTQN